jgi:hypothetical protein
MSQLDFGSSGKAGVFQVGGGVGGGVKGARGGEERAEGGGVGDLHSCQLSLLCLKKLGASGQGLESGALYQKHGCCYQWTDTVASVTACCCCCCCCRVATMLTCTG